MLVNIFAGSDLTFGELDDLATIISQISSDDASVVVGGYDDPRMATLDEFRVTLVVTGLDKENDNYREEIRNFRYNT